MPLLIVYTVQPEKLSAGMYHQYLGKLPPEHQDHILRYKFWQDAQRCLFGKLLLEHGLLELGIHSLTLQDVKYTSYQRPYFESDPVDFNISHSGDFVVCAIAAGMRVGVDIEEVKPIGISDFHNQFTEGEIYGIGNGADKYEKFFHLWTKKEAVMKANGQGFSIPPKNIIIDKDTAFVEGQSWFLTRIDLSSHYRCHLATNIEPTLPLFIKKYVF